VSAKLGSQEIVVVALLVLIGFVVLCGYFVVRSQEPVPTDILPEPVATETFVPPPPQIPPAPGEATEDSNAVTKPEQTLGPLPRPRLELSPGAVSFGTVDPYTVRTQTVTIKNTGESLLEIRGTRTACGCMQASVESDKIEPGEQSTLTIEFNPQHYHGPSPRIRIMVYSNDPTNAIAAVVASADIQPEFTVEPQQLDFGTLWVGEEVTKTLYVEQQMDEELEIQQVVASHAGIETAIEEITVPEDEGKRRYKVDVRVTPDASQGSLASKLTLRTSIKRLASWPVGITGQIVGVEAVPACIHFGLVGQDRHEVARAILRGPYPFEVTGIESSLDGFSMQFEDAGVKRRHMARIMMEPSVTPGQKEGVVKLRVYGDAKEEVIFLPIHGVVLATADES